MIGLSVVNSASKSRSVSPCGCSSCGCKRHQVDDVDDPDLELGNVLPQQVDRRQRFERRDVAGAGHHDIGLTALIVARPLPDADASRAVPDRRVHVEPLRRRLLARDDDVDVVPAPQAMVGHGQQRVGVGRQIDPHDFGLLVHDVIDEARILMAEAVVVLTPDVRRQQIIERRDRPRHGISRVTFSHLACWLNIESTIG